MTIVALFAERPLCEELVLVPGFLCRFHYFLNYPDNTAVCVSIDPLLIASLCGASLEPQ